MDASELDFDLPAGCIATAPVEPQDNARLLVCSRSDPGYVEHRVFRELPMLLRGGDRLVFNTTAVVPARLGGVRMDSGGKVEGLYMEDVACGGGEDGALRWRVLLKSNGKLRAGARVDLGGGVAVALESRDGAAWVVRVEVAGGDTGGSGGAGSVDVLGRVGATPLPPYILSARREGGVSVDDADDRGWYQTVYADMRARGSVAAPTAGLHFTQSGLDVLAGMGVDRTDVLLHVGAGTFKPISEGDVSSHAMHAEAIEVSRSACGEILGTRAAGGRVVMVGTTAVRACESVARRADPGAGYAGPTDLYIRPGFAYRWTDGLVTNFHLPRSTLLLLVGALLEREGEAGSGVARLMELYREAVDRGYRFFSYGDAMLVLP